MLFGHIDAGSVEDGERTGSVVPAGGAMQVQLARAGLLARVTLRVLEALRLLQVLPVRPAVERHLHHMPNTHESSTCYLRQANNTY